MIIQSMINEFIRLLMRKPYGQIPLLGTLKSRKTPDVAWRELSKIDAKDTIPSTVRISVAKRKLWSFQRGGCGKGDLSGPPARFCLSHTLMPFLVYSVK